MMTGAAEMNATPESATTAMRQPISGPLMPPTSDVVGRTACNRPRP